MGVYCLCVDDWWLWVDWMMVWVCLSGLVVEWWCWPVEISWTILRFIQTIGYLEAVAFIPGCKLHKYPLGVACGIGAGAGAGGCKLHKYPLPGVACGIGDGGAWRGSTCTWGSTCKRRLRYSIQSSCESVELSAGKIHANISWVETR